MGPSARVAAFGSALTLAACAVIAGLDDPRTESDATSAEGGGTTSGSLPDTGSGSSSGGGSSSGATSNDATTDGASSSGAPIDAQPDAPQCSLAQLGDNCTQHSQCCSKKCNEERKCVGDCRSGGSFGCDPTQTNDCCVGFWCNNFQCAGCVGAGQPAAQGPGGIGLFQSCCSRALTTPFGPTCL